MVLLSVGHGAYCLDVTMSLKFKPSDFRPHQNTHGMAEEAQRIYDEWLASQPSLTEAERTVAELKAAFNKVYGHSNCYCEECKKLRHLWDIPKTPDGRDRPSLRTEITTLKAQVDELNDKLKKCAGGCYI